MPERSTRRRLDTPAGPQRRLRFDLDTEAFGRVAERLARFLGTGTYLLWQTVFVIVWIALNLIGILGSWDPYPFILLNLAFSTQAAYAAPLILLAQNRQDDRDRVSLEEDRARAQRTIADTEYLSRELAAVRLAVGEMVTRDFLRSELSERGAERSGVDRETQKALTRAVDKSLDRSLEKALDRAVEKAVERALSRVPEHTGPSNGTGGTDT
ncbi:DUF1003 domain-containing protein [Actinomycetospora sp. Odt1-22]|uniref:DUF1003 domain-containing protein n=1 Tax=Actinomycetospora termitidis TaxID=3053470 RepID=A0ABT7M9H0_9PSEU|nr:DUF1003 domain-containing protein [Actinomycetospora sp. Odt1-22]MDL5157329.1 DUF1003 domain-containing protein [Actinomycetospora sp. Odt1-22]